MTKIQSFRQRIIGARSRKENCQGEDGEPIRNGGGVEDAMAAVDHVVVDGDHHHGWIKDDATNDTGVHCRVPSLGGFPFLLKLFEYLSMFRVTSSECYMLFSGLQPRQFMFLYLYVMNFFPETTVSYELLAPPKGPK